MQTIKQSILTIIICLAVVAGVSMVSAWTGAPPSGPPNDNTPTPINISTTQQIKSGPLQVNGFRNLGSSIFDGNVGIGTMDPKSSLHIKSDSPSVNAMINLENDLGVVNQIYTGRSAGGISGHLVLEPATGKNTIINSGNVGIGKTVDPGTNKLQVNGNIQAIGGDICTDQGGGKCLSAAGGGGMRIVGGTLIGTGGSQSYDVSDANLVFLTLIGSTHAGVGNYWLEKKADGWYISGYALGGKYSSFTKLGTSALQFRLAWSVNLYDMYMQIVDANTFYFWTYGPYAVVSITKFATN